MLTTIFCVSPLSDDILCSIRYISSYTQNASAQSLLTDKQFLRAKAECFARLCHRLGVCPSVHLSVRLSVTLVSCIKTVQARITKSSLWAVPWSLVYHDKILCHWMQGLPLNEGVEEGYPLKNVILPLLARIM